MKEKIIKILKIVLIVFAMEVILFNITSYRTFLGNYDTKEFSKEDFEIIITENEKGKIKIDNIEIPVATIKFETSKMDFEHEYNYEYSDETTKGYMSLPSKMYLPDNLKSQYTPCYLSGNVNSIILNMDKYFIENELIEKIIVNEKIPFEFNFIRFFILVIIGLIIDLFKNSEIMNLKYEKNNFKQELMLVATLGIFMLLLSFININSESFEIEDMYNKGMVDALLSGSLSLLEEPSEEFLKIENPYDALDRMNFSISRGEDYLWDTAYYKENFYVYFGILPVLVMFLPYFCLTGKYLTSMSACFIVSIIILILLKEIISKIFEKYFKNIPFKFVVLSLATLYSGSLIYYINGCVRFYEVAIVSGVCLVLAGVLFMLKAMEKHEKKYRFIILSCFFMALSVACRPTNVIASIILVPYLLKEFLTSIKENKKSIAKCVLSVVVPYLIVAIPLMWYNYARFDSVFEFGSKYQITINDMTHLESRIFAIPVGLLCNLFSIPKFIPEFPFVINHNEFVSFTGFYFIENMIGGLFILAPICFMSFYIFKFWKKEENKELKIFVTVLLISGIIIASISAAMGGSIQRYLFDYAWMFVLAGILIFASIYENLKTEEAKNILIKIFCILTIYTIIINLCAGIVSEKSYFERFSPELFQKIKYAISFWR